MKPDWKDAPEWANYLARDCDDTWYWFEDEPILEYGQWCNSSGKTQIIEYPYDYIDSLESRPTIDHTDPVAVALHRVALQRVIEQWDSYYNERNIV